MTSPDRPAEVLFVTDDELVRRLNIPWRLGKAVLAELSRNPRFPPKQKAFGDRRYYPAVKAYFDKENRVESGTGAARLIPERPVIRTGLPRRSPPAEPLRKGTFP